MVEKKTRNTGYHQVVVVTCASTVCVGRWTDRQMDQNAILSNKGNKMHFIHKATVKANFITDSKSWIRYGELFTELIDLLLNNTIL